MKLLYIASVDFYSKPNPSFHLMCAMIEDLLDYGVRVEFIGCAENGLRKHIPDNFLNHPLFHASLISVAKVKKSKFFKRYLNGIQYSIKLKKYIKRYAIDCDVIFVQSSPTVVFTLRYAKKYSRRHNIIYNIQDMFPGSSIASGVMKRGWMQKIFYSIQKIAYRKADIITVISEDMKKRVCEQGVEQGKIHVIYNWFDDHAIREVFWEENRFVKKYNLDPFKFYVQYAGTMGYVFDYNIVLEVAERLSSYSKIEFQMIGEGSQKDTFMTDAKLRGLTNIKFYPLESQEMVSDVYSACTVCFIPLKKGVIGNSVPSKTGLLMACKRPIITSADIDSEYCTVINKYHLGIAVDASDYKAVVDAILALYNDRAIASWMGKNGFKYGQTLYSRKYNMDKYLMLFDSMADGF